MALFINKASDLHVSSQVHQQNHIIQHRGLTARSLSSPNGEGFLGQFQLAVQYVAVIGLIIFKQHITYIKTLDFFFFLVQPDFLYVQFNRQSYVS